MQKIIKWLDNFWYHYKWRVIVISFFLVVFLVCAVQCASKVDADVNLIYVGPEVVSGEAYFEMENILASRLDGDTNRDGERKVQITDVVVLSDEQLAEKKAEAEAEDDYLYYDTSVRASAFNNAKNWMVSGEMLICILDPYAYSWFEGLELFVPLSEYLDEVPAYAHDEYSLVFAETPFAKYFDAMDPIAEDTLLCLVKPTYLASFNGNNKDERYEAHIALIRKMVEFSVE